MVEQIRSIRGGRIEIDTNKQTYSYEFTTGLSVQENIEGLTKWATDYGFIEPQDDRVEANPDTTGPSTERWLTGVRTFARRVGTCPRCKGPVEARLMVEVKVDMNRMYWDDRTERPCIEANTSIGDSKVIHECSDTDPCCDEEDH